MTEIHAYIILLIVTVAYLNSHTTIDAFFRKHTDQNNLLVIEHLAQFSSKTKNYRRTPENYQAFGYAIRGFTHGEEATLEYRFPLIDEKECAFSLKLHARNVSSVISDFGGHHSCFNKAEAGRYQLASVDHHFLSRNLNSNGFFYNSLASWGVDYNHVIKISNPLCVKIAHFIVQELQRNNKDSYVNRVKAALNFVQYIPYGVPDFDTEEFMYFGLALPHESVAISYSDCDSKSCLLAGILTNMIAAENIVLVTCTMDGIGHMITGVSGLPFQGQQVRHNNKQYLMLETTTPIPFGIQEEEKYTNLEVIPVQPI